MSIYRFILDGQLFTYYLFPMTTASASQLSLKVGDSVWIATALLHQQNPEQGSFPVAQIVQKVKELCLTDREEISIYVHANQHCVANRPPNPAKLKMLFETANGERRLFCQGDTFNRHRDGRTTPKPTDLPPNYRSLLDWYQTRCSKKTATDFANDPLLTLRGLGRALWADEHADEYIANLREESR